MHADKLVLNCAGCLESAPILNACTLSPNWSTQPIAKN